MPDPVGVRDVPSDATLCGSWRLWLAAAVLAATPGFAQMPALDPAGAPVPTTPLAQELVLDPDAVIAANADRMARLTVPVTIDGHGPYPFVVDTGADRTVVSRELADTLQLAAGPSATMHTMSGVGSVRTVVVPRLSVGGRTRDDRLHAPALSEYYLGAKGLLGVDSLVGRRVVMDFVKQTFTVSDARVRERVDPDTIVVTARSRFGQLVLVDADVGGVPITVIVDSGAQNSIGNMALQRMLAKRRKKMTFVPIELVDVTGGKLAADLALIDGIRIGGFSLNDVAVAFVDAHPFKRFELLDRPAMLLGMDTMRVFERVSVDFAARKVRFLLPDAA